MEKKVKKLALNKETLVNLKEEQLLKPKGGFSWDSWCCATSNGPYFCDHACA